MLLRKAATQLPEGLKRCARCEAIKPHAEFSRSSRIKDGFQSMCKDCDRERKGSEPQWEDPAPDGQKTCSGCRAVNYFVKTVWSG